MLSKTLDLMENLFTDVKSACLLDWYWVGKYVLNLISTTKKQMLGCLLFAEKTKHHSNGSFHVCPVANNRI